MSENGGYAKLVLIYYGRTIALHTLDKMFCSADSGNPIILVSLQLSAAFNVIDHSLL